MPASASKNDMMNSSVSAWKGPALLLSACIIWGCQFPVSKAVLTVIDPMELVFLRLVIGVLCLLIIGLFCHVSWKIEWQHWPLLLLMSLSGYVISIWAQFYGTALTTSQISAVIMSTIPIGMVILSRLILKEHITRRKGLAVCTATAGVIIIIGIGDIEPSQQFGGLLLLLAVITVALMMVLVKKVPSRYSMLTITMYCMLISDIILAPFESGGIPSAILAMMSDWHLLAGVLFIGIFATGLAYYFWNKGLTYMSASTGGMYLFVQPITGTLLGWMLLGETIGLSFLIGTAMILGSGLIVAKAS